MQGMRVKNHKNATVSQNSTFQRTPAGNTAAAPKAYWEGLKPVNSTPGQITIPVASTPAVVIPMEKKTPSKAKAKTKKTRK